MTTSIREYDANESINHSSKSRKVERQTSNLSLRGPTGPTTQRGKQKSSYNAVKHGIFSVGLVRDRESRAQYRRIVEAMVETLQPVGRLEEILVEKLAMLVWRYRRLLQAEAAEIGREAESAEEGNVQGKTQAALMLKGDLGLIPGALLTNNEVALVGAIEYLKKLRQHISEKGLDWERDRDALTSIYGTEKKNQQQITVVYADKPREKVEPNPAGELVSKYRELVLMGKDQEGPTSLPADAAKSMVGMLDEKIETYDSMLDGWCMRSRDRNRLQATTALVPRQEVADRLQRYEGSLDRSFDRTLSQLERLQRLRLGQPVPPALRVDVSH